jgi:hypothetical protein
MVGGWRETGLEPPPYALTPDRTGEGDAIMDGLRLRTLRRYTLPAKQRRVAGARACLGYASSSFTLSLFRGRPLTAAEYRHPFCQATADVTLWRRLMPTPACGSFP